MSRNKKIAKGLGASALAIATIASGLSFGAASATAAPAASPRALDVSGDYAKFIMNTQADSINGRWNALSTPERPSQFMQKFDSQKAATDAALRVSLPTQGDWLQMHVEDTELCFVAYGTDVALTSCSTTADNQRFKFDADGRIVNKAGDAGRWIENTTNDNGPAAIRLGSGTPSLTGEFAGASALSATATFTSNVDERATVDGKTVANGSVEVREGATVIARGTADADGAFSIAIDAPNKAGDRQLSVVLVEGGSDKRSVDVTAAYGAGIAITGPADNSDVTGPITVTGTAQPGSTATLKIGGAAPEAVAVTANGQWSKAINVPRGEVTIVATAKSKGANTTTSTVTVNPGESSSTALTVAVGAVNNEARSAEVSGTATAGAEIRVGNTVIASAGADGSWSGRITGLNVGANTVEFVQFVGGAPVDAVSKDINVIATGFVLQSPKNNDVIRTADKMVTFTGLGNPGGKVSVLNGSKVIGSATVDAEGKWSFTSLMAYTDYDLTVYYKKIPSGGLTSQQPLHITVTNNEQNAPFEITTPKHQSTVQAPDNRVTFTGTGTTGGTVTLKKGSTTVGTAVVDGAGKWTFTSTLSYAKHSMTAYYKKTATSSAYSTPYEITVSNGQISLPFVVSSPANNAEVETEDKSVTFTGEGAGGGKVVVRKGNAIIAEGVVDNQGKWSLTGTLNYGAHDVTVFHKPIGETKAQQQQLHLTVKTPASDFVIETPSADATVAAGAVTFTGKGKPDTSVSVFVNSKARGTAVIGQDGTWTLTTTAIGAGAHDFVVYHKLPGSQSADSETVRLTLR